MYETKKHPNRKEAPCTSMTCLITILDNQLSPFVLSIENRLRENKNRRSVISVYPPVYFEMLVHFKKYHNYMIWDTIRVEQIFSSPVRFSCGKYCGGCRVSGRTTLARRDYSITATFMER